MLVSNFDPYFYLWGNTAMVKSMEERRTWGHLHSGKGAEDTYDQKNSVLNKNLLFYANTHMTLRDAGGLWWRARAFYTFTKTNQPPRPRISDLLAERWNDTQILTISIQSSSCSGFLCPGNSPGYVLRQLRGIGRIKLDIEGEIPGASCNYKEEVEKNKHTRRALW